MNISEIKDDFIYRHWGCKRKLPVEILREGVSSVYRNDHGRELDFEHPKYFTEKIQLYKLYYHHPELSHIVDKADFKEYIAKKLGPGHTIEMYGVYDSIKQLKRSWDLLPPEFVIKSTVQSDGKYINLNYS